jgi:hypothetical protein
MDNYYTSIPLAKQLLDKGISLIGTLRANRKGIPPEIKSLQGRENFSTEMWWEKEYQHMVLTSYVVETKSKGKKNVLVLSTLPPHLGVTGIFLFKMSRQKYNSNLEKQTNRHK